MRFNARHLYRYVLVGGALVALSCAPSGAWAQQNGNQTQTQTQGEAQFQFQGQLHSADWAAFDEFLDAHPDIADALRDNPDLLEDQNFLGQHNDLKTFCDGHQGVRQDVDRDRARFQGWFRNRSELAKMDRFLDTHANVELGLRNNPSLITSQTFLNDNPQFRDFLNANPDVKNAFDRDPARFMTLEDRMEIGFRDHGAIAIMDQYMDSHENVARQIEANPALLNDQKFLNDNKDLRDFLTNHPRAWDALQQNPQRFMQEEAEFEGSPADRAADNGGRVENPNPGRNPNPDLNRGEVAGMDQFLDQHPDIEKQLQANPSLISNQDFLRDHPALQSYLNDHPNVQAEFAENPTYFMNRQNRYENSPADRAADNGNVNRGNNPNPDLNRGEVASMDQFLDQHTKIQQQLQSNPSLINNSKYLNDNPSLRTFLNDHPQVREEFTENPSYFMQQQGRFEGTENNSGVATMDAYLDKHADEARDLNAYPARVNDSDYLSHHKDLDNFLKKHPEVREQFSHNPSAFMHQESAFDASAEMEDFLDNHKNIRKDLDQNPESVKNDDYLDHHKDLKNFLAKNPGVGDQFQNNPGGFMDNERKFEADRDMDFYLTKHKNVAKDLQKDPDRVKDAKYLDHHKDLKQIMDQHPDLEQAANSNPSAFMQAQMKFHEQYQNQQVQQKTKVQQRATTHPH